MQSLFASMILLAAAINAWAQTPSNAVTVNKAELLKEISRLGSSRGDDILLLRSITGHLFDPKPQEGNFPADERRYREFAPLPVSPIFNSGLFSYRSHADNQYQPSISLTFRPNVLCIKVDEIESILGKPSRYHTVADRGRGSHPGVSGPGYITGISYQDPNLKRLYFSISIQTYCVTEALYSSYWKTQ